MSSAQEYIHSFKESTNIFLGPAYAPPARYVHAAYVKGDIDYNEAFLLLTQKYGFGEEGAKNALLFDKQYPHMVSIPTDYERKLYGEEPNE